MFFLKITKRRKRNFVWGNVSSYQKVPFSFIFNSQRWRSWNLSIKVCLQIILHKCASFKCLHFLQTPVYIFSVEKNSISRYFFLETFDYFFLRFRYCIKANNGLWLVSNILKHQEVIFSRFSICKGYFEVHNVK